MEGKNRNTVKRAGQPKAEKISQRNARSRRMNVDEVVVNDDTDGQMR